MMQQKMTYYLNSDSKKADKWNQQDGGKRLTKWHTCDIEIDLAKSPLHFYKIFVSFYMARSIGHTINLLFRKDVNEDSILDTMAGI